MSQRNAPLAKSLSRSQKIARKRSAAKRITHLGIYIQAVVVRQHRYLRAHGLGFSASIANVHLRSDWGTTARAA